MMIRKKVQRKCKIRGYTLKVDALDEILSFVNRFQGAEDDALDLLLDHLLDHDSCISLFSHLNLNLNAFSLLSFFVCLFVFSEIFNNRQGTRAPCRHPFIRSRSSCRQRRWRRSHQWALLLLCYSRCWCLLRPQISLRPHQKDFLRVCHVTLSS